jgi:hypothetical protein
MDYHNFYELIIIILQFIMNVEKIYILGYVTILETS